MSDIILGRKESLTQSLASTQISEGLRNLSRGGAAHWRTTLLAHVEEIRKFSNSDFEAMNINWIKKRIDLKYRPENKD